LIDVLGSALGRPIDKVYRKGRAVDVPANVLDITKARRVLCWEPRTSLQDGLTRTLRWMTGLKQ